MALYAPTIPTPHGKEHMRMPKPQLHGTCVLPKLATLTVERRQQHNSNKQVAKLTKTSKQQLALLSLGHNIWVLGVVMRDTHPLETLQYVQLDRHSPRSMSPSVDVDRAHATVKR
eukprot:6476763-Amphidinium_carterae.1